MSVETPVRRLAAILCADIAGYSRLMAADEDTAVRAINTHRETVGVQVRDHGGHLVDFTGDSFLAEFGTATAALACALEIQRKIAEDGAELSEEQRMQFRLGVHVGEIRIEGERTYGNGVHIAARLQTLAEAGGICISASVYDQVRRLPGTTFEDLGEHSLKNIPDVVHVFRARAETTKGSVRVPVQEVREAAVAVLPFVNMSADPDQEFFGDGMAEELINALTRIEGLRVIARTSAFSFKGTKADIATIGSQLGATAVVEGSVRRSGDRLRITAQLVDVAGGYHLWSETFDRAMTDVFEIQDEIAATVVRTIRPKLLKEGRLVPRGTESAEAYELYLRAGERIRRLDRWEIRTAIEMLRDATELDPNYADAWGRLGEALISMGMTFDADTRWHAQAEAAIERALALDESCAVAHYARGRMLWSPGRSFKNHEALCAIGHALELQPGSHDSRYWYSAILLHVGLLAEAREGFMEVLATLPDHALTLVVMSQLSLFQGNLEEAGEWMDRTVHADATQFYSLLINPSLRAYLGEFESAERALQRGRSITGSDPMLDAGEALLWAKRGEPEHAERALAKALDDRPSLGHLHHTWHFAAAAFAVLGQPDKAADRLRAAMIHGLPNLAAFANDPHITPHREHPEMQRLFADLALEDAMYRRDFGH